MTSRVTCGPWASSCTSCEYRHLTSRAATRLVPSVPRLPPAPPCTWRALENDRAAHASLVVMGRPSLRLCAGLPMPGPEAAPGTSLAARGLLLLPWRLAACLPGQGLGEERGSALAPPPRLSRETSALPQPVRLPALLLQHGPGHLPGDEEEDPPGPVRLPQP